MSKCGGKRLKKLEKRVNELDKQSEITFNSLYDLDGWLRALDKQIESLSDKQVEMSKTCGNCGKFEPHPKSDAVGWCSVQCVVKDAVSDCTAKAWTPQAEPVKR